jgi:hypothetical protein
MKTMTEPATDKHLDELSKRVDFGLDQTGQRLGRVEDDLRALRTETQAGFDRVHGDEFTVVRREVRGESATLRAEMKAGFDKVDEEFTAVRGEMRAGFDGLQRQMTRFFAGTLATIIAAVVVSAILSHL